MEILSFDISGKFAHFRKYYANNTAMTYSLPPRTTIIGIIAGAMGLAKDSYYQDFKSENIRIAINIVSDIKKSFHRLNHLMINNTSDFRGKEQHTQTPFEIVSGINPQKGELRYRIFIACTDSGQKLFEAVKQTFKMKNFVYAPTLGTANFSANINNIQVFKDGDITQFTVDNEEFVINSACLSENVEEIVFKKNDAYRFNMIEEELLPADFKDDNDRELSKMNRVLFSTGNMPLNVKFSGDLYALKSDNSEQIIQFLD